MPKKQTELFNSKGFPEPDAAFEPVPPAPPRDIKITNVGDHWGKQIKPHPWIMRNRMLRGGVTMTVAMPGAGKSAQTIHEAIALATGRAEICGFDPVIKDGRTLIYNAEDTIKNMLGKLMAICEHYNVPKNLKRRVNLVSGIDHPLRLAYTENGKHIENIVDVKLLEQMIHDSGADVVVLDPLVGVHSLQQKDISAIAFLFGVLRRIAYRNNCCIHGICNSFGQAEYVDEDDDTDAGCSIFDLSNFPKVAHTLSAMTEQKSMDKSPSKNGNRRPYLKITEIKNGYAPPQDRVVWRYKHSLIYNNLESYMILTDIGPEKGLDFLR